MNGNWTYFKNIFYNMINLRIKHICIIDLKFWKITV